MDETLRTLERAAAAGDPDASVALYAARLLLGSPPPEAEPPVQPHDPRAEDRALRGLGRCYDWPATTRNQAAARAFTKGRRRRALRRAGRAICRDWDED